MDRPDHKIKGLIFDLNGVLFPGAEIHNYALKDTLDDYGFKIPFDIVVAIPGATTLDRLKCMINMQLLPENTNIAEMARNKRDRTLVAIKNVKLSEHTRDAINWAKDIFPCAVATNSDRETAEAMLESAGLLGSVNSLVTAWDFNKFIPKPNPRVYIEAARKLGIYTRYCLAFEDTDRGAMSALDAGCRLQRIMNYGDLTRELIENKLESLRIRI